MNYALLLVDLQKDYFQGGKSELYQPEQAAEQARQALDLFRANQWPIFHIRHVNTNSNAAFFAPGTQGAEIYDLVVPLAGEPVIIKHRPNSFYETDLEDRLRTCNIDSLIICGMMSHLCIDTTVRAAKDLGYTITVLQDACTTKNLNWKQDLIPATIVHSVFMASLQGSFAKVIMTHELPILLG